jgi:hypothetical protein
MNKAEELRKMLAVMRQELHDDGVIQYALQHAYNVLIKFIEYTEELLGPSQANSDPSYALIQQRFSANLLALDEEAQKIQQRAKQNGQEDTQSHAKDEEGGEGHQAGQAKGCDTSAQGRGKEERKAKARRPGRKRPAD